MKEDIKETRLENGLVVLTDRMPDVRSATLGFFYRIGARNEPTELNGISHFIEHCVFKGTGRRSALDIAIEQERLGGNLDAFTTHEETGFVLKVIDDRVEAAFDLLADMLTNSRFDDTDLENEQRVIIEELKMNEDSPEDLLSDIFQHEFFRGHSLGLDIAGTPETVRSFDSEKTRSFHRENFHRGNLVIAAAGNIEHENVVNFSENYFHSSLVTHQSSLSAPPTPAAPISMNHRDDLEQVHFVFNSETRRVRALTAVRHRLSRCRCSPLAARRWLYAVERPMLGQYSLLLSGRQRAKFLLQAAHHFVDGVHRAASRLRDLLARETDGLQMKNSRLLRRETRLDLSQEDVALDLFDRAVQRMQP